MILIAAWFTHNFQASRESRRSIDFWKLPKSMFQLISQLSNMFFTVHAKGAMLAGTNLGAAADEEREQLLGDHNAGVCQRMIEVATTFGLSEMWYTGIPQVSPKSSHGNKIS
jgi:hypothetical protein